MEEESIESFLTNDKVIAVINLLTKFRIKLWELKDLSLPESQKEVEELLMKLSDESGLVENELKSILIRLQQHSLRKLAENKRFNEEQIAVFKLKIIGNLNKSQQEKISTDQFEASINLTGFELSNLIKATFDLNCDSLKVICNGKVLKDDSLLISQDIKNHSTLMAMCVYNKVSEEMASNAADYKLISDIKDAVGFLTDQRQKGYDIGLDEFKLSNQNGRSIDISPSDTRILTSAMILHEKAKNLMKSKDYLKALILLAEADNEFKNCSDRSLLERVDNYALLNLDIIWCYLCLENLNELKNAEERLQVCESCLKKCYGSDLERLSKIKGETINKHTPIFVRINLLNAILQYHKGKKRECREYLEIASRELKKISIDEEKLLQVMSMGFSSTEARLALRASFNNVDEAIEQILKQRRDKQAAKKIEKEKEREEKLTRKYGRTLENKTIDTKLLDDLIQIGYEEKEAAIALVRANNNFQLALDLIPSVIAEIELQPRSSSSPPSAHKSNLNNIDLSQLSALGFDIDLCKKAFEAFGSDLEKAANFLLENRSESETQELKQKVESVLQGLNIPKSVESELELRKKTAEAQNLLSKISSEIPEDDEAYLDLNTDEDAFYINKYYSLLD